MLYFKFAKYCYVLYVYLAALHVRTAVDFPAEKMVQVC